MFWKVAARFGPPAFMAAAAFLTCRMGAAQDLEPRAYSRAPVGTNFVLVSYAHSSGDVLLDPTILVQNANVQFNTVSMGYYHSFGLFGRQTTVSMVLPYVWGSGTGLVNGVSTKIYRSGLGDPGLRISYNLYGSPAVSPQEFKKLTAKTVVGVSVVVTAPLGQYDPRLLINIGTNRWSFKPQIGFSREVRSWAFDLYLGGYFFTENPNFFGGHVRHQDPIGATQVHISYTLHRGMWAAVDGIYYTGGRTTTDGVRGDDLQQNVRVGLTFALPITRAQSLKFQYTRGAVTRVGGNFTTAAITYQFRFTTPK
ncbi:MAG TPA: transporter [Candidatus Angelobacter sp.]